MNPILKLNPSTTTIKFPLECRNFQPGRWILEKSKTHQLAQALFQQFVTRKMPQALKLIEQLNNTHHLSAAHLPLSIYSVFFIYIAEQIELYQNQMDERDVSVDNRLAKFKEAFAKERYELFTHNPNWANEFFDDLRTSLAKADALPQDFDKTLSLWLELITIAHVGDVKLATCFHPEARTTKLLPAKVIKVDLQRDTLEASFYLLINQLSLNFKDIERFKNKMAFPNDADHDVDLLIRLLASKKPEREIIMAYSNAPSIIQSLGECLKDLLLLDLSDNLAIKKSDEKLKGIFDLFECYKDLSNPINQFQESERSNIWPFNICVESKTVDLSKRDVHELLSLMRNRQECHLFFDCHLLDQCLKLLSILRIFTTSNEDIARYYREGVVPPSHPKSLLPPPSVQQYNEEAFLELCATPTPEARGGKPKKKAISKSQQTVSQPAPKTAPKQPLPPPPATIPVELPKTPELDSLELLRRKFLTLYHLRPHVFIRQAIWHVDTLITLKETLKTPAMNKEGLTLLNLTASSAHKVLEQTYRFCLANRNMELLDCHNLKTYESTLGNSSFAEIVNKLYLANHWTRYFYIEKQRWTFSTCVVAMPTLVQDFVDIADGKALNKNSLGQKVLDIIEKTRAHAEKILPELGISLPAEYLAEDMPIQPKLRLNSGHFNNVKTQLTAFLAETKLPHHHPAYLHLKQAVAALNILKGSLQGIQTSKTPRELATWTSLCVQQIQETLEDVLRSVECLRGGEASFHSHDLKKLASELRLEMGELGDACHLLSYKSRYPAENLSNGLGAQIIDDIEAIRQFPGYLDGFKPIGKPPLLWSQPEKDPTLSNVMDKLCTLLKSAEVFLRTQAIPALQQR